MKKLIILFLLSATFSLNLYSQSALNPQPPALPVRLIFIHHSTGQNWLDDNNGGLGIALKNNNYYVSDTNYGWGPFTIGDRTDIGNWWEWFRSDNSADCLAALYNEAGQNCSYSRLNTNPDPDGENNIIMFKSCFPNSALSGNPGDAVPSISSNPLKGESCGSDYHTVANAKGIYIDILEYFKAHQEKLFIVIAAPPLSDATYSSNARAFNQWLVSDWLKDYAYNNVFVFDFYNVLTSNGGNPDINDLNASSGNHHRYWQNAIQHKTDDGSNTLAYFSGDDHPSQAGNLKASAEFIPLLNIAYNKWKASTYISEAKTHDISFSCFPVPFTEKFTVSFNSPDRNPITISISDPAGRKLYSLVRTCGNTGNFSETIDSGLLQKGIYFCTLSSANYTKTLKIIHH